MSIFLIFLYFLSTAAGSVQGSRPTFLIFLASDFSFSLFHQIINPTFSELFSKLINECLESGIYPDCIKVASIKPLHKKNSKFDPGNYRPISLLSNIGKIFEKVLHDRLTNFLESDNIFFENQFGFRKKHNTFHAIIALTKTNLL